MREFWTIQSYSAWDDAKIKGYLVGNKKYISEDFIEPYHWMMKQMKKRLPNYEYEYPVWLWTERPDLRSVAFYLPVGERAVLLKVEIDESKVLLSDFQAWHFVLNNNHFTFGEETEDCSLEEKEASWDNIFNFDLLKIHPDWGVTSYQGVTGTVYLNEIKVIREFYGRYKSKS